MLRRTERTSTSRTRTPRPAAGLAALAAAAVALTLSACGGSSKNPDGLGGVKTFAVGQRTAFPALSGQTIDGGSLDMASLKGRVTVVNIWGSWCGPCKKEMPYLEHAYEANKAAGVAFVGINTRDIMSQAAAFATQEQVSYPSLFDDQDETLLGKLAGIVPLQGVPSTIILDRDGRVAWRKTGEIDYDMLAAGLAPIVAGK
jgi:thiol-disulfide isomerase/thioredoxin